MVNKKSLSTPIEFVLYAGSVIYDGCSIRKYFVETQRFKDNNISDQFYSIDFKFKSKSQRTCAKVSISGLDVKSHERKRY